MLAKEFGTGELELGYVDRLVYPVVLFHVFDLGCSRVQADGVEGYGESRLI